MFVGVAKVSNEEGNDIWDGLYYGWIEGFSIIAAIFIITLITTLNNYQKEKNFIKLHEEVKDIDIGCIRGQSGTSCPVKANNLVVGDVMLIEAGMRVPADCMLLDAADVIVDESDCGRSCTVPKKKFAPGFDDSAWDANSPGGNPDAFIFADSLVLAGSGKAVILCVG